MCIYCFRQARKRLRASSALRGCVTYCHDHLVGALRLCQMIQGVGFPPPLTLIYRGLPPIKLLLFRAFLESLYLVTPYRSRLLNTSDQKSIPEGLAREVHSLFADMSTTSELEIQESSQSSLPTVEIAIAHKEAMITETPSQVPEVESQPSTYMSGLPLTLLMLSISLGTFLVSLDRTIITVVSLCAPSRTS
jgi:hypothetical protein